MPQATSEHTARVRSFFDHRVAAYDAFYEPASPMLRRFNRLFRKAVYLRRDQVVLLAQRHGCRTVLDVGCGSGRNSVWFVRNGIERVMGVDISAEMLDEARRLASQAGVAERCEFRCGDFIEMAVGPTFDLVAAVGVFDYVERPEPFLKHMAQFANRVIYGSFPGWTLVRSPLRKVRYLVRGCPTRFYRRSELPALFRATGFGRAELRPVPSGCLAWAVRDSAATPEGHA